MAIVAAAITGVLILPVAGGQFAAFAEGPLDPVLVNFAKDVTPAAPTAIHAGEQATFTFSGNCSSTVNDCVDLTVSDTIPAPLVLAAGGIDESPSDYTITRSGNSFSVKFTHPLDDGRFGLEAGGNFTFSVRTMVPADVDASFDQQTVTNTAFATVANADSNKQDSASVLISAPVALGSSTSKTVTPATAFGVPGSEVGFALGAGNTSNSSVDSLVIQDPATVPSSTFDYLDATGFGPVTFPSGADRVRVDWFDGTDWHLGTPTIAAALPTPAAPARVQGVRLTFTSTTGRIARSATAAVTLTTAMRQNAVDIVGSSTVTNVASSQVALGAAQSTPTTASGTVVISKANVAPVATKTFSADSVVGGRSVGVSIGASNGGNFTLDTLTVTEPTPGSTSLIDQGIRFSAWKSSAIEWPIGAASAAVSYLYDDGSALSDPVISTTRDTLPQPPTDPTRTVIGFVVTFSGSMGKGEYATLPFTAATDTVSADSTHTDSVTVDAHTVGGQSGSTTATDDLTLRSARINTTATKTISPTVVYSAPGASALVALTGKVDESPTVPGDTGGSTVGVSSIVVGDEDAAFFNTFDLAAIVATDIPIGSTLTVTYRDATGWHDLPGAVGIEGHSTLSMTIPAGIREVLTGIRFDYVSTNGDDLVPGFNVLPYLKVALRDQLRDGTGPAATPDDPTHFVSDTATSTVTNPIATPSTASSSATDTVGLAPVPQGGPPMIEKAWTSPLDAGLPLVVSRSGSAATTTLSWGTGGIGFDSVMISDSASDPATTPVADTVFEAFNLVSVQAIGAGNDPLLTYDKVKSVELYLPATGWTEATNDPCTAALACDGVFPGVTLTATESANAVGVRLVIVESPTRALRVGNSPDAPLVGSGVAESTDLVRHLSLNFVLRDDRRSSGGPVLGLSRNAVYNEGSVGVVRNTASVDGRDSSGATVQSNSNGSNIQIVDRPINTIATKTWEGGPLGIPPVGTPQSLYPSAQLTIAAKNTSLGKVNSLAITEPTLTTDHPVSPFDFVNIDKIISITVPDGTSVASVVTLTHDDGSVTTRSIAQAIALSAGDLADVTSITVTHTGRVDSNATTTVALSTQLRADRRSDGTPVTAQLLSNRTTASVVDPGGSQIPPAGQTDNEVTAPADAQMEIAAFAYGVTSSKVIVADTTSDATDPGNPSPAIQYAGSAKTAKVTLGAQPIGNVRTTKLVIEDSTPGFWDAYNFTSFGPGNTGTQSPINRVSVDALVNGAWIIGTEQSSPALPAGATASNIRGLRFTYLTSDFTRWERPFNPEQYVTFTVTRRDTLASDPSVAVASTLHTATSDATTGVYDNVMSATVSAATTRTGTALWAATSDSAASIRFQHLPARVKIVKSPFGSLSLGADIPFTIAVTNTGVAANHDRALGSVVVADVLPSDSNGPMLVIPDDPDTGSPYPVASAFTYTLTNASGVQQAAPTVTSAVGASTPGSAGVAPTTSIVFTLVSPATLDQGYTLTINATLRFRAQLAAATAVTNIATVTSDQLFETCDSTTNSTTPKPQTNLVTDCSTDTTVMPLPSAPMSIVKGVKGVDAGPLDSAGNPLPSAADPFDDLGVIRTTGTADCTAPTMDAGTGTNDYYRYPCVPITRPGATEEWASKFTNSGNITVEKIVAIDVLPAANDRGVIVDESRGSKWTPTLSTYPTILGLPAGWGYTVQYLSTLGVASPRCNGADIQNELGMTATSSPPMVASYQACLTNTGKADDLANRNWQTLLPTADATVLGSVVAMKFIVKRTTPGIGDGMTPGTSMSILYRSTTALVAAIPEATANLGRDSIAYNSVAGAALGVDGANDLPYRFVSEPRKVGVAMATGDVKLSKTLAGLASSFAPAVFLLNLDCTSQGTQIALKYADGTSRSPFSITPGAAATLVEGLPLYAKCTVSEVGAGQTSFVVTPATPLTARAASGSPSFVANPHPAFDNRAAIESASITNTYDLASFTVGKTVNTGGAQLADGTAVVYTAPTFTATCTYSNKTTTVTTLATTTFTLLSGATRSFADLPAGSSCTVTETNTRSAATTTNAVTGGTVTASTSTSSTFTLARNTTTGGTPVPQNAIAFTNNYTVGSLALTKTLAGLGSVAYGTGAFTVHVVCTRTDANPTTVWSGDRVFSPANGYTATLTNIATGASCAITEPAAAGATSTTLPTDATIGNGTVVAKTVTNTFDRARLSVTKVVHSDAVDGDGQPVYPGGTFPMAVACTWQGGAVYADGFTASPMTFSLGNQGNRVLTGLPAGASCVITETSNVGADSTNIATVTGTASATAAGRTATVTLARDTSATAGANTATVNNNYGVATFTVAKELKGAGAAQFGVGPFTIHVVCVADGGVESYNADVVLPTSTGAMQYTIDDLAQNSSCSIAESNFADTGADASVIRNTAGDIITGRDIPVVTSATATIENWYLSGALDVTKTLAGDGADAYGVGPFTVSLVCTRDGEDIVITGGADRVLEPGAMSTRYTQLPSGASCTLSETTAGGATKSTITGSTGTVLAASAATGYTFDVAVDADTLTDDQDQPALTVQNTFTIAPLTISKTVHSSAVDASGDPIDYGSFPVAVECTFEGNSVYATGYDATTPMARSIANAGTWALGGLPAGAVCSVTESDAHGASGTAIKTTRGSASAVTTTGTTASLTLGASAAGNSAEIVNSYDVGGIDLSKHVAGDGAAAWGTAAFDIRVTCTLADGDSSATVWNKTYTFHQGDPVTHLSGIAAGAQCAIDETKTGAATSTTVSVDGDGVDGTSSTVTVASGETAAVVVTNTFDLSAATVTKVRTGDGATLYGDGPFEVTLVCGWTVDGTVVDVAIPGGATRSLDADGFYTAGYFGLPFGADCSATETVLGGADASLVVADTSTTGDSSFTTGALTTNLVVTNTFDVGSLVVTKLVLGEGADVYGAGPFEVTILCTREVNGSRVDVAVPDGAVRSLTADNGYTVTYTNLPARAECGVTESKSAGATSSTISDESVTIPANDAVTVDLTNTFDVGSLDITLTVGGTDADAHRGDTFVVTVACTMLVDGVEQNIDMPGGSTREFVDGDTVHYAPLPVGALCTIVQTQSNGANVVLFTRSGLPLIGSTVTIQQGANQIAILDMFITLASTGLNALPYVLFALLFALVGAALIIAGRIRRRRDREEDAAVGSPESPSPQESLAAPEVAPRAELDAPVAPSEQAAPDAPDGDATK